MSERHRVAVAAYLILRRGDKVLLGRRANTGWYDGWYGMPAGKIEAGELPVAALVRECQEEVGIELDPVDVTFAHAMYRESDGHDAWADYFFVTNDELEKYEPFNNEPEKCDDLQWFELDDLPENMIPNNRQALEQFLEGMAYSDMTGALLKEQAKEHKVTG